jgi:succinyl-CoA synthetase beta subunit
LKFHECDAKSILSKYGVGIPPGGVANTASEAGTIAASLESPVVIKAQIHAGGRFKGGGVKIVDTPKEAGEFAGTILGKRLITPQTGPVGSPVDRVLIEEAIPDIQQLYFSIILDPESKKPLMIASEAGGTEIEDTASNSPEKIHKEIVDPSIGFQPFQGRRLAAALNLSRDLLKPCYDVMHSIYNMFIDNDLSLVEINPLALTPNNTFIALDAKITIEDDSLFRHPDLARLNDPSQLDPLECKALDHGIAYVKLDGDVGCLVNGAGLAMATMDVINIAGAQPANFLDVGGGASEEKSTEAFRIILDDPQVKSVLINVFGGILRCDIVATAIVNACAEKQDIPPIVVRMQGTNSPEGRKILSDSNLNIHFAESLADATDAIKNICFRKID